MRASLTTSPKKSARRHGQASLDHARRAAIFSGTVTLDCALCFILSVQVLLELTIFCLSWPFASLPPQLALQPVAKWVHGTVTR